MSAHWQATADLWSDLATRLQSQVEWLDEAERGLAESWKGDASEAARVALADLRARTTAMRLPAERTAELLAAHAAAISRVPIALSPLASLAVAAFSDARTARGIASLVIPSGRPAEVRAWWSSLSPAERDRFLAIAPERIGWLDGIAAADRDRANRLLLQRAREEHPRDAALARLESRLGKDVLLLGFDPAGDGRAIVAFGDPDHARNVLTFVPGMSSGLNGTLDENLSRTAAMARAATDAGGSATTSAVLWIGYDAPDTLLQAAQAKYAHAAREALHTFQEGLIATHDGDIGEQSVVGYSYGALVVGETARDVGLPADDLVFLGAPGVGVDKASQLHVDPGTVWAASAGNDAVGLAAPSVKQLLWEQISPRYMGDPMPDLWHGHNPADAGFGGHLFAAADRTNPIAAHLSYWDTGNPALANVGRIAAGAEDRVTRP